MRKYADRGAKRGFRRNPEQSALRMACTAVLIGAASIVLLQLWAYTGFVALRPGVAAPAGELGGLAGAGEPAGPFFYTSVVAHRANAFEAARALVDRSVELVPIKESAFADLGWEAYASLLERQTDEAKRVAATVALREAGYRVAVDTVAVVDLVHPSSPLLGRVPVGSAVVGVDGIPVRTAEEAYGLLHEASGERVRLAFVSSEGGDTVEVEVGAAKGNAGSFPFGLVLGNRHMIDFPMEIAFESAGTVGSSAGLMFALELYRQLTGGSLGGGAVIAGTGALRLDGTVDAVDGVKQKVIAAKRANAAAFVLPRTNVPDALGVAQGIALLPVDTFAQAVEAVRRFGEED